MIDYCFLDELYAGKPVKPLNISESDLLVTSYNIERMEIVWCTNQSIPVTYTSNYTCLWVLEYISAGLNVVKQYIVMINNWSRLANDVFRSFVFIRKHHTLKTDDWENPNSWILYSCNLQPTSHCGAHSLTHANVLYTLQQA